MMNLIHTIQTQLTRRFEAQREDSAARGQQLALAGMSPEDAYQVGRAEGFWNGVVTLLRSGLVRPVTTTSPLPGSMRSLVEKVH